MIHDVGSQIVTCHLAELTLPPCSGKSHTAQLMPLPLTVSCFSKIRIGFTFLVSAHPGKGPLNGRVCVCVCGLGVGVSAVSWHLQLQLLSP